MARFKDFLTISWILVLAALLAVAAISLLGGLLGATSTFAVRSNVSAGQGCWSIAIGVDGGDRGGYQQCGGEAPHTTDLGRCAHAINVIARPNGGGSSTVSVDILMNGQVVQTASFDNGGPTGTQFVDHSC